MTTITKAQLDQYAELLWGTSTLDERKRTLGNILEELGIKVREPFQDGDVVVYVGRPSKFLVRRDNSWYPISPQETLVNIAIRYDDLHVHSLLDREAAVACTFLKWDHQ